VNRSRAKRAAAWLGACVVGLVAATAAAPGAAVALPQGPHINLDHTALLVDGGTRTESVYVYNYDGGFSYDDVVVTIDTAKLAGVASAKLTFDSTPCKQAGTMITCAFDSLTADDKFASITTLSFTPEKSAKLGDVGEVSVKLTSGGKVALTRTSTVTISEKVELAAGSWVNKTAKPGDTVTNLLQVKNAGTNVITGVDMFFFYEAMFTVAKRYDNCEYGSFAAYCHFDTNLEPGAEYVSAEEMPLVLRKEVPAPGVAGASFRWHTPVDGRDNLDMVRDSKATKGNQGTLRLVKKPAGVRALGAQTEDSAFNGKSQHVFYTVEGLNRSDVAGIGGEVRGAVGSTVTAKVGVRNLGPAYAQSPFVQGASKAAAVVAFKPPTGTTVVKVPAGCRQVDAGYACETVSYTVEVGESVTWDFGLRIDAAGELVGTVEAKSSTPDVTADNDTGKLIVNPAGGSGAGLGTLPVTGAPTWLLGGAALALLVVGGVLFVASRRRSATFVA
jgi:hypothetical protein